MPAVSAVLAPKACFPYKNLLLDSAQHQQNQACGGKLRQHAEDYSHCAGQLCRAKKNRETFAHADALAAALGIFQVAPAAAGKYGTHHQAQQQNGNIFKPGKLRKNNAISLGLLFRGMGSVRDPEWPG
jgi:hypothetical protein